MADKWNMATRKSDTDIAESTIDRAKKRLRLSTPTRTGDSFYLSGLKEFDDAYDEYHLRTDGKGTWWCDCYGHYGGEFRREKVCSHAAACALFFNLPCERTLPLKEELRQEEPKKKEPERRTPERPRDIPGIPEEFDTWRPGQRDTVEWITEQLENTGNGKVFGLDGPVGEGKSLEAIAALKLVGGKGIVFVSTKPLQLQYQEHFPDAAIIWGRENYDCIRFKGTELTAADCTHRKYSPCPKISECPYKQAERTAQGATMIITNYSYGLHKLNLSKGFPNHRIFIGDEADLIDGETMKFVSLTLTRHQLEQCQIEPPEYKTKLDSWLKWAPPTLGKIRMHLSELESGLAPFLEAEQEPPKSLMWELLHYQRRETQMRMFVNLVDESWVPELDNPEQWEFKPTFVRRFGHLLTDHADKFLVMSATLLSAKDWGWNLGIDEHIPFRRNRSTFPKEIRPIVPVPAGDLSYKKATLETKAMVVRIIDGLLDKHAGEKGLIHAISYDTGKYIRENSSHRDRLITHTDAGTRTQALDQLISSDSPLVLVSPSFGRGVDLFGDRARFQIIVKLPFMQLKDKQTKKRRWSGKRGERWFLLECVRAIVQMSGRIVRSADDYGVTYILDSRFERFYKQMEGDFPEWFREAIQW